MDFCFTTSVSGRAIRWRIFVNNKLYVSNLPFSLNDSGLGQVFDEFGNVVSAKIITDRDTGRSKGFGFVEMSSSEEAEQAIAKANGKELNGRAIRVALANPPKPRQQGHAR
jgi:RNA recognition motif-containing protein